MAQLDAAHLGVQQRVLLGVQCGLEARELRQLRGRRDVVLREERAETAVAPERRLARINRARSRSLGFTERAADHVRLGNEIDAQQLR